MALREREDGSGSGTRQICLSAPSILVSHPSLGTSWSLSQQHLPFLHSLQLKPDRAGGEGEADPSLTKEWHPNFLQTWAGEATCQHCSWQQLIIHSFVHSFPHLWGLHCVPGTVLGANMKRIYKKHKILALIWC